MAFQINLSGAYSDMQVVPVFYFFAEKHRKLIFYPQNHHFAMESHNPRAIWPAHFIILKLFRFAIDQSPSSIQNPHDATEISICQG
jgi:hypothetical protein